MSDATSTVSTVSNANTFLPVVPEWRRTMNRFMGHRGLLMGFNYSWFDCGTGNISALVGTT
ncbi:hypothetical protein [Marinomonas rhodophyticola]|uniref:Uncharacterized protein n=1 Tax=Marinomonas rhodophyticola TaxID=2992803 RepID=A0ABT3KL18_9GAMM|nr:hypothetical protein [Marinomonas sp. KJ51-3]MCW4631099.1 hypothetical protein [Marinomonas sp. KJ51-3]